MIKTLWFYIHPACQVSHNFTCFHCQCDDIHWMLLHIFWIGMPSKIQCTLERIAFSLHAEFSDAGTFKLDFSSYFSFIWHVRYNIDVQNNTVSVILSQELTRSQSISGAYLSTFTHWKRIGSVETTPNVGFGDHDSRKIIFLMWPLAQWIKTATGKDALTIKE